MRQRCFTEGQLEYLVSRRLGTFVLTTKPRVELKADMSAVDIFDFPLFLKYSNVVVGVPLHISISYTTPIAIKIFLPSSEYEVRLVFWRVLIKAFGFNDYQLKELTIRLPDLENMPIEQNKLLVEAVDTLQYELERRSAGNFGMMMQVQLFQ